MASFSVRLPLCDGFDLGAQQAHAEHVERLAGDVDGAHVDLALEPHQRRRRGGGHAVLAGAGLGDDPGLAHPLGEQRLAEHVVDLVRPVWLRSSRLSSKRSPSSLGQRLKHSVSIEGRPA